MFGTFYIVATPIGNLKDITLRAIDSLKEVDLILAEDTRVTKKLLDHYQIDRPIISYHHHSSEKTKSEIFQKLITGNNLALVTDAGTPGISDPGNELIEYLLTNEPNIKIIPIPGVSAITSALSVCGFDVNHFVFLGFLPKKKRNKLINWLKEGGLSFAFYESPYRVLKTLDYLKEQFGEFQKVFIAREMTKFYESHYRGTISEVKEKLQKESSSKTGKVKGEFVVVVAN